MFRKQSFSTTALVVQTSKSSVGRRRRRQVHQIKKGRIGGKKGQDIKKSKLRVLEGQPSTPRVEMSGIEASKKEQSLYKEGIDPEWIKAYDNT